MADQNDQQWQSYINSKNARTAVAVATRSTLESVADVLKQFRMTLERENQSKRTQTQQLSGSTDKLGVKDEHGSFDIWDSNYELPDISLGFLNGRTKAKEEREQNQNSPYQDFASPASMSVIGLPNSQIKSPRNSGRSKYNALLSMPRPSFTNNEYCSMTVEHIRNTGNLYGPEAISAVSGIGHAMPKPRENYHGVIMTRPRSDKTTSLLLPPKPPVHTMASTSVQTMASTSESSVESTDYRHPKKAPRETHIVGPKPETDHIRSLWKRSRDIGISDDKPQTKPNPIRWKSNNSDIKEVDSNNNNPKFCYKNVSPGRQFTFFDHGNREPKIQKKPVDKLNVPCNWDVPADKESHEASNICTDFSYKRTNKPENDTWFQEPKAQTTGGNPRRRRLKNKRYTNRAKLMNVKQMLDSNDPRPIGPKIEGLNSVEDIYPCEPEPSYVNFPLAPSPVRIIRTVVLPFPSSKYMNTAFEIKL